MCGLQWSPDDRYLASGGNDNLVCIYSASEAFKLSGGHPDHVLNEHVAAVKAIAWCPWKPTLLATGGGTRDHHLRFWNVYSGACVRAVDVETQVRLRSVQIISKFYCKAVYLLKISRWSVHFDAT